MPHVDRGDATVWWQDEGDGEPLLLIMGLGYPADMWWRLLPVLRDRFRTIRFDNRGVGRTGVPPGPYSVETMAADAAAVLDAAGESSAHVIGVSMGGVIAQELVLAHPQRVRSLVLACTHPGGADIAPFDPEALRLLGSREKMTPEEAAEAAVPFVYAPTTPRARIDEDLAVRRANPTPPQGYVNQLRGSMGYRGSYSRLGSIQAPTLVVAGTADRLVNPDNSRKIAAAIPGARLEMLDGASHIFFTDQPARTTELLLDFLATVRT